MHQVQLSNLRVAGAVRPIGLWTARPRFSWQLTGSTGVRQTGYEVIVETERGVEVCRTGRIVSAESSLVDLLDADLAPATVYRWRVRSWIADVGEEPTDWVGSDFETARFARWSAPWIEPEQLAVTIDGADSLQAALAPSQLPPAGERLHPAIAIRHTFEVTGRPVRARLRATAQGVYQAELNGESVGDQVLAPGYESYQRALSYQTYDVTDQIVPGSNTLGLMLGDGWFAGRISLLGRSGQYGDRLRASWQVELTAEDGSTRVIWPDESCVSSTDGPIRYADLFIGERHDARRRQHDWSVASFDDTGWGRVRTAAVDTAVSPFVGEPVRRVAELPVVEVLHTPAGETVLDFGQVLAGRVRMRVSGAAGTEVVLEHCEVLDQAGNYLNNILGVNKDQQDVYLLGGDPAGEVWEPLFAFHGFRYCRLSGYPGPVRAEDFTGVVLSSDLQQSGSWTSNDERLDRLHQNVVWEPAGQLPRRPDRLSTTRAGRLDRRRPDLCCCRQQQRRHPPIHAALAGQRPTRSGVRRVYPDCRADAAGDEGEPSVRRRPAGRDPGRRRLVRRDHHRSAHPLAAIRRPAGVERELSGDAGMGRVCSGGRRQSSCPIAWLPSS